MDKGYNINKPFWQSKKWWMAAIAVVIPLVNQLFALGLDVGEITAIAAPVVAYILGQSYVDASQ